MEADPVAAARIDPEVKARAALVSEQSGLTISDAVRIMPTRTADDGALPFSVDHDAAGHDAWFRARVQAALDDPRPECRTTTLRRISPPGAPPRCGGPVRPMRDHRKAGVGAEPSILP
jgi:DNA-damage-inducible protein J